VGKGFNTFCITPSFWGALLVRLVIEGTIIIVVHLITLLLINVLLILAPIFDPAACISVVDDITHVSVIPITPSTMLLWWSETTGRVPAPTQPVVKLLTSVSIVMVTNRFHHDCCIQHRLEVLYMCIDFFIVLRQVGCELVNEHP
jgi:hypothetical protein